jgi:hypothetical protein
VRLVQGWRAKRAYLSHPTRAARAGTPHLATICHAFSVKTRPLPLAVLTSALAYARDTAPAIRCVWGVKRHRAGCNPEGYGESSRRSKRSEDLRSRVDDCSHPEGVTAVLHSLTVRRSMNLFASGAPAARRRLLCA